MTRLQAVELLILRHENKADIYAGLERLHRDRVKELKDYRYELTRPGFKTKGWTRATRPGRVEPYVIHGEITP